MKATLLKTFGILLMLSAVALSLSRAPDRPVETLVGRWAPAPSDFIDLGGQMVHVRDEGPRDDPSPVVLLHGTSASLHTWEGWALALRPDFQFDAGLGQRKLLEHVSLVCVSARKTNLAAFLLRPELFDISIVDISVVQDFDDLFRKASRHSRVFPSKLCISHPLAQANNHPCERTRF